MCTVVQSVRIIRVNIPVNVDTLCQRVRTTITGSCLKLVSAVSPLVHAPAGYEDGPGPSNLNAHGTTYFD
jgi:hypothetical protein